MDPINKFASDANKAVRDVVQQGRVSVTHSSEAILEFTRENPLKALMIAAVSGTFFWAFAKALAASALTASRT